MICAIKLSQKQSRQSLTAVNTKVSCTQPQDAIKLVIQPRREDNFMHRDQIMLMLTTRMGIDLHSYHANMATSAQTVGQVLSHYITKAPTSNH